MTKLVTDFNEVSSGLLSTDWVHVARAGSSADAKFRADRLVTLTDTQTLTNKTLTAPTLNGTPVLGTASAWRTALGLALGADVQAYDGDLSAIAALVSAADRLPYATGAGLWTLATFTAAGRALIDDADAAAQRTTLGLGTIATQAANSVALTGGAIDGIAIGATTPASVKATTVNATSAFQQNGTQVLGARNTGWSAMTGSTDKATVYDTASVTLPQLAGRVMALQAALTTHGAIGA